MLTEDELKELWRLTLNDLDISISEAEGAIRTRIQRTFCLSSDVSLRILIPTLLNDPRFDILGPWHRLFRDPRLVARALRRIEAAAAWVDRQAEKARRRPQQILDRSPSATAVLAPRLAILRLGRRL